MNHGDLSVNNLTIQYNGNSENQAVGNVSFVIKKGETLGIIGESGSGKSSLALCIMGLLNGKAKVSGQIIYEGVDLCKLKERERESYRWHKIALVFQNTLEVLNPILTIKEQLVDVIMSHQGLGIKAAVEKAKTLIEKVGLASKWVEAYPHQLSGGMRQRILIAMAISCNPEVLIMDEPTASLDLAAKDEMIALILQLQREKKFTLVVISHEIEVIKKMTRRIAVMYSGQILEVGIAHDVINYPYHTYTRGLINATPNINPYRDLWGIPGEISYNNEGGCPFFERCNQSRKNCQFEKPRLEYVATERLVACNQKGIITLLEGKNIHKTYKLKDAIISACKNCEITIRAGEIVAIIGASGSGKTTLANILAGILEADCGEITFCGKSIKGNCFTRIQKGIQIVFQDPFSSTNELLSIKHIVMEPLNITRHGTKAERIDLVKKALRDVQLPDTLEFLERKAHQLSGGQRQRVAIARALVMHPKLLIADEISAMLDPSTQANILRFLKGLQNERGFSMLYVTHDVALTHKIADYTYVMKNGDLLTEENTREMVSIKSRLSCISKG